MPCLFGDKSPYRRGNCGNTSEILGFSGEQHGWRTVLGNSATDWRLGFRIDTWKVRPVAGELLGPDGAVRHLEPKVMEVLVELARAYPEVLERESVIQAVWGSRPVSDDALARCVTLLRRALGDSTSEPRFIQTVPKRGYRLLLRPSTEPSSAHPATVVRDEDIEGWTGPTEFDNLKIVRLLGRGSMGWVHLAQEVNLERLVAVKTLRGVIADDERARQRFRREASAAARIDHPNITSIFRLGELADGTPYIVMQYVRGRTLGALLTSSGDISEVQASRIVLQIATGLAAAHRERIVHRDVKPANVLIEQESDQAILSDFGLAGIQETGAKIATRLTLHGEVLGDARYISPEQARGEAPTPASDIYSLGVVAYELLTGAYPFAGSKSGELPQLSEPPMPMSRFKTGINPTTERVVMQALARNADERPTADQFVAALSKTATTQGEPATSTPAPPSQRKATHRMAVLLATGVLIAAIAGVTWYSLQTQSTMPDFREYAAGPERKAAFFGFIRPLINAENDRIRKDRERLQAIAAGAEPGFFERRWLAAIAADYAIADADPGNPALIDKLLRRVDSVPLSLALAQAAKESGWGTSRFARNGNNLFGEWCFVQGCGIVPQARAEGRSHEVRRFRTARQSVASYLNNINTHPQYAALRQERARLRAENRPLSGIALAKGLTQYSERRGAYVEEISQLIRTNNLEAGYNNEPQ